jgi:DNA polymerase bacteriophage-type
MRKSYEDTRSRLLLDCETYATVDLKAVGAHRYVEDPFFEVLMCAWSTDGETVQVAVGSDVALIPGLDDPDVLKVAHNASFDRLVLSKALGYPNGKYLPVEQWSDTAARAAAAGLPRGLDKLASTLGVTLKDQAGTRLINLFCKPHKTRGRTYPIDAPEQWAEFVNYCKQDVLALIDVDRALPRLSDFEHALWVISEQINDRGIAVDLALAQAAVDVDDINRGRVMKRMRTITDVENPNSQPQLLKWFQDNGAEVENLQAETMKNLAKQGGTLGTVAKLRQQLALTTAKKYQAALDRACHDSRVRGAFMYWGAHTGRWSGRGMQLQNLTRSEYGQDVLDAIRLDLTMGLGAGPRELRSLIRSTFVGPFAVADFAQIEARVLAWLADERWALRAFADGRDIYVETATKMGSRYTRQDGKTAVLALGYQGSLGALRRMGADGSDEELLGLVSSWRNANRHIVRFWRLLEEAFVNGGNAERIKVNVYGSDRHILLPSGRELIYRGVRVTSDGTIMFKDPRGFVSDTYGGKLTENCLAGDSLVLTDRGWLPLQDLPADSLVWDGVEWVTHGGLLYNGEHQTVAVDGVRMTPEHRVLTTEGWQSASSCAGSDWAEVQLPDRAALRRFGRSQVAVGGGVHLRYEEGAARNRTHEGEDQVLWLPAGGVGLRVADNAWDEPTSGIRCVEVHDRPLSASNASGVAQLRGSWHHRLRALGRQFRELLAGHGGLLRGRSDDRAHGQRRGVLARKLSMGHPPSQLEQQAQQPLHRHPQRSDDCGRCEPGVQHQRDHAPVSTEARAHGGAVVRHTGRAEQVYDIANCGPRHRFMVMGERGPFIVHNCTQAVARDVLAESLVFADLNGLDVVAHVHDEILVEGGDAELQTLLNIMGVVPNWAEGLPIDVDGFVCERYRKG